MDYDLNLGDNLDALESLSNMGRIDKTSAAYGVARRCFTEGYDSLTAKQKYVYDKNIAPAIKMECAVCGEDIELTALPLAYEEKSMLCSYHRYRMEKERDS